MEQEKSIFEHLRKREIPTPDAAYFEALARQIPQIAEAKKSKVIPLYRKAIIWSLAATVALTFMLLKPEPVTEVDLIAALDELSDEEVIRYVENHLHEFDTELIVSVLPDENVESVELYAPEAQTPVSNEPQPTEVDFNSLEEDDILEYLESMGLETTDLEDLEIQ